MNTDAVTSGAIASPTAATAADGAVSRSSKSIGLPTEYEVYVIARTPHSTDGTIEVTTTAFVAIPASLRRCDLLHG